MFNKKQYLRFQFWVMFCLVLSGIPRIFPDNQVQAQIVPDKTLVNENSVVTPINPQGDRIDGGAIRGSNLFHSFTEFNIGAGREAYFSNPAAIANIFSRVTGNNPSQIFGKLGVLGDANLFLLNPNGIIFGDGASLDIKGSFFATTASSFNFGSGKSYSAINPVAPPLLTVDVKPPIGLEFAGVAGDIENRGNLLVGKDLTLEGNNLNLQGSLQGGKDLTLKAENRVKVRDTVGKAFIAVGGGKLLIQGKESVDIVALNHADSGLFSGGDMFLKSARTVVGNVDFFSGGRFRVEKLDDSLGSLFSPNGSIIRAGKDVSFDSYTGASLHIFTGGSVNVTGVINIRGTDTAKNSIQEQVTISDGETVVEIDGSSKPTLDIRAGIVGSGEDFSIGTSADIKIRGVSVEAADGLVFLSNRYQSDESKKDGSIELRYIFTDAYSFFGNGGSVFLDSRGDIDVGAIFSSSGSGNGGDINLIAANSIQFQRTNISSFSSFGKGGDVNLIANDSIQLERSLINSATVGGDKNAGDISIKTPVLELTGSSIITASKFPDSSGNGGKINIDVKRLTIDGGSTIITNSSTSGKAGNITVNATDLVEIIGFSRAGGSGISSQADGVDNGGNININTNKLIVRDGGAISVSTNSQGDAGNLNITAKSVEISNQEADNIPEDFLVRNPSVTFATTGLFAQANPGSTGNGGKLNIDTENLLITDGGQVGAGTFSDGDGGEMNIKAKKIELIGNFESPAPTSLNSGTLSTGDAGKLTIETESLLVSNRAELATNTSDSGKAATLTVNASKIVEVSNRGLITSSGDGTGDAGDLIINAPIVKVLNGGQILSDTIRAGEGGSLTINATELFELGGTSSEGVRSFLATATFGTGNAGKLTIIAPTVLIKDRGQIRADTFGDATGNGNDINIQADTISLSNQANISAGTTSQGNAGNITVTANIFEANNDSKLRSATNGSKKAGNITLNIKNNITLTGDGTGIFANATRNSTGNSGSIIIDPEVVNIFDGAEISVNSSGEGIGGDIKLTAGKLNLDNGTISAKTRSNTGGDITLNIQDLLLLRNNSEISTTAGNQQFGGNGGNIEINNPDGFIVAFPNENSDITANAFSGNGGNIDITAFGIFGIEFRQKTTSLSDITASSSQGLDGNVNIETPGIEPNPETVELPEDAQSTEVAQGCQASGQAAVAFFNIGRGGLPSSPGETLNSEDVIAAWIPLVMEESQVNQKVSTVARSVKEKKGIFGCES